MNTKLGMKINTWSEEMSQQIMNLKKLVDRPR